MSNRTNNRLGYTVVELMVTIVIVSVLAATVGMFISKLLTIQEQEREEAYIRERLADICGAYADDLSIGSSFSRSNKTEIVAYRLETGGVSLETGRVTRVAYLTSATNATDKAVALNIYSLENGEFIPKFSRNMKGDATLIPLTGSNRVGLVSFRIRPLNNEPVSEDADNWTSDAALGYLVAKAEYYIKNDVGEIETKTASVERVVRLWNKE